MNSECSNQTRTPGSKAFARYEQYQSATTRKEYKEKGGTTKDWKYDLDHGFIQFKSVKLNARVRMSNNAAFAFAGTADVAVRLSAEIAEPADARAFLAR